MRKLNMVKTGKSNTGGKKPYVIMIASQKGGVGKTTIAVNLAVALRQKKYEVLLIDGDTSNPTVAQHLGMSEVKGGMRAWVKGKVPFAEVVRMNKPTGVDVINGLVNSVPEVLTPQMIKKISLDVRMADYDFVIIDSPPGQNPQYVTRNLTEGLIVSTPHRPSMMSTDRLSKAFNGVGVKHRLVLNRVTGEKYELTHHDVMELYEGEFAGIVPEDQVVHKEVVKGMPTIMMDRNSSFSTVIWHLAGLYAQAIGYSYETKEEKKADKPKEDSWSGMFRWFRSILYWINPLSKKRE